MYRHTFPARAPKKIPDFLKRPESIADSQEEFVPQPELPKLPTAPAPTHINTNIYVALQRKRKPRAVLETDEIEDSDVDEQAEIDLQLSNQVEQSMVIPDSDDMDYDMSPPDSEVEIPRLSSEEPPEQEDDFVADAGGSALQDNDQEPEASDQTQRTRPKMIAWTLPTTDESLKAKGMFLESASDASMAASLSHYAHNAIQNIGMTGRWMTNFRPLVCENLEKLKEQHPLMEVDGKTWTQKDREAALRRWTRSPNRERLIKNVTKTNNDIQAMYKSFLRLYGRLPEDLIGWLSLLQYDTDQNRYIKKNKVTRSEIWSSEFCKNLKRLSQHPIWQTEIDLLATAIQYTIRVDTNDRTAWDPQVPPFSDWSLFVKAMVAEQQKPESHGLSSPEIRRVVVKEMTATLRQNTTGRGGIPLPKTPTFQPVLNLVNALFETIEDVVENEKKHDKKKKHSPPPRRPNECYKVKNLHLKWLIMAVESMSTSGFPMFPSVDVFNVAISKRRPTSDYPQKRDMEELRDHVLLREMERDMWYKQNMPAEDDDDTVLEWEQDNTARPRKSLKRKSAPKAWTSRLRNRKPEVVSSDESSSDDDAVPRSPKRLRSVAGRRPPRPSPVREPGVPLDLGGTQQTDASVIPETQYEFLEDDTLGPNESELPDSRPPTRPTEDGDENLHVESPPRANQVTTSSTPKRMEPLTAGLLSSLIKDMPYSILPPLRPHLQAPKGLVEWSAGPGQRISSCPPPSATGLSSMLQHKVGDESDTESSPLPCTQTQGLLWCRSIEQHDRASSLPPTSILTRRASEQRPAPNTFDTARSPSWRPSQVQGGRASSLPPVGTLSGRANAESQPSEWQQSQTQRSLVLSYPASGVLSRKTAEPQQSDWQQSQTQRSLVSSHPASNWQQSRAQTSRASSVPASSTLAVKIHEESDLSDWHPSAEQRGRASSLPPVGALSKKADCGQEEERPRPKSQQPQWFQSSNEYDKPSSLPAANNLSRREGEAWHQSGERLERASSLPPTLNRPINTSVVVQHHIREFPEW